MRQLESRTLRRLARLHLTLALVMTLSSVWTGSGSALAQSATPGAASGCVIAAEPNDQPADATELPQGASCASAENVNSGQDLYKWTLTDTEAARRWTISTSAVSGQAAALEVYTVELDGSGTVLSATKLLSTTSQMDEPVSHQDLLWAPGTYYIGVATSGPGPYQLTVAEGEPVPAAAATTPAEVSDAFAVSGPQAGPDAMVTWTIDEAGAGSHWTLQLQGPVSSNLQLVMTNTAGETLLTAPGDPAGIASVPDLGLPAGAYTISLTSTDGNTVPWILESSSGDPIAVDRENEPNETAAAAMPIPLTGDAIGISGRLATRGPKDTTDVDRYRLTIDAGHSGRLTDFRMLWQGGGTRKLCLLDGMEQELRCIDGADGVALSDLVLPEGEYTIVVSGVPDPDDPYTIRIDITGEAAADFESEPNDSAVHANPLAPKGDGFAISGRSSGTDYDTFRITVAGEPQLWLFEATGPGVTSINLLDVIGSGIATGQIVDGTASLYDIFLVPGDHLIQVTGADSEYTLTATPLGPPDPLNEREPNDALDRSEPLLLLDQRTGRLVDPADADVYRFALQNPTYLRITVEVPGDGAVGLRLNRGPEEIAKFRSPEIGQSLTYDGWLLPGDYAIWLSTATPSQDRYTLKVEPLDPFTLPADLEPNDKESQANPMPASLSVSGISDPTVDSGDIDWYLLPAMAATQVGVTFTPGMSIQMMIPGDSVTPSTSVPVTLGTEAGEALADIPADTPVALGVYGAAGPYDVAVEPVQNGTPVSPSGTPAPGTSPVTIEIDTGDQPIAAYWSEGQRIDAQVTLTNAGTEPVDIALDALTGQWVWTVAFDPPSLTLGAGETRTVPMTIHVAPDAWADQAVYVAVRIAVRATGSSDQATAPATALALVIPSREAPPLNAERWSPLPEPLLGGLDAAWSGLGGTPVAVDEASAAAQAPLYDQLTTLGYGWRADVASLPQELTVDLAGDDPVSVTGIAIYPPGIDPGSGSQVRGFELELSLDGQTFTPAFAGELAVIGDEQSFVLDAPVEARFARLRILSAQSPGASSISMGEWKVIAEPGWTVPEPLNLANPAVGGHIVDLQPPPGDPLDRQRLLTVDQDGLQQTLRLEPGSNVSWIAGFHHDRAARITSFTWVDPLVSDPALRFDRVTIEVSTETPTGPWLPLSEWTLERDASGVATLNLDQPAWARFVRFTGVTTAPTPSTPEVEPATVDWQLPDQVQIRELAPDETYRSILGEWGGYRQTAIYEQLVSVDPVTLDTDAGNDAASATLLPIGKRYANTAAVTSDEDWYRVEIPGDSDVLTLTLTGEPALGVSASLFDASNAVIEMGQEPVSGKEIIFTATVEPGATYLLQVTQPPTSVIIAFDTSFSIGTFEPAVYQGLNRFAGDIRKGREAANVLPFGADLLLPDWSDEPYLVQGAIASYPRNVTSSDAEGALLTSIDAFEGREGNKAIILITDAESTVSQDQLAQFWPALAATSPRIYSVGISGSGYPAYGQDLMQDWAAVNSGHYVYVRDQGEMDIAFDRAATELRRPSIYTVSYETEAAPPTPTPAPTQTPAPTPTPAPTATPTPSAPGAIEIAAPVLEPGQALPASRTGNVAIVFDTSGSMLQSLEGRTRAEIARAALTDLVTNVIPAGTNVSLRTFGDTPDSCETRLVVPSGPLDPVLMSETIATLPIVNLVKTPIGASLEAVADDLGSGPGPKIVVLVTDGEETCGGDPAAAIEALIASGVDVRVNIVGFAIDDQALQDQFEEWARLGKGVYIDAGNADELNEAVALAVLPTYEVLDTDGTVVASGQVGGLPVDVPPGTYRIVISTDPETIIEDVIVPSGETISLDLPVLPP